MQTTLHIRTVGGILIAAACFTPVTASAAAPPRPDKTPCSVGQIFIVGNTRTQQSVILDQVPLYPGQILNDDDLRLAEKNLKKLGIFAMSPKNDIGPKVTALNNPLDPDNPVKDIIIKVQETSTASLSFGLAFSSSGRLCSSLVIEERNFDILHIPMRRSDLFSGDAFRGAGQMFRLELIPADLSARITVSPLR